ncbi:MAG: alanine racemase [Lachnospiraceae bacterium]|nr:alanine racemase [Lachnospiraceae bacterium]
MENENLTEKYINERYYRACATVNLDAIYDNVVNLGKRLKEGTKIIAVVKTDGYGHGAIPIAKTINELVYAYAVATVDEAVNLRRHGIIKPIYVIGYTHESQLKRLIAYDIRASVFTYDMGKAVSEMALAEGKVAKIHIKVDTGMSRIGFKPDDESAAIVKKISELPNLEIEGIFTHFAKADEKDKMATRNQYELFSNFINKLEKLGVQIPVKHCSNSAAMMELPEYNLDACRAGIAMYGLYPSEEVDKSLVDLKPALGLKSHIAYIKTIEKGTEVSYGGTFVADREMKIATIPLGYGDGYRRSLSNKGYVLINGKKANILGRICMDQFMVDVTDINASKDDEVVLLGKSGNEEISAERLAEMAGLTFNYEIVCDIGKRIPRVFYRNNKIVGTKDYFDDKYTIEI